MTAGRKRFLFALSCALLVPIRADVARAAETPNVAAPEATTRGPAAAPPTEPAPQVVTTTPVTVTATPGMPAYGPDGTPALRWAYRRFDTLDYVVTGLALGVGIGASIVPVPDQRWSGSTGIDDAVRSTIKANSYEGRRRAADVSDVGLGLSLSAPILFDALLAAWSRRGSGEVAKQLVLIDLQTFAVNGAITALTSSIMNRERPYGVAGDCGTIFDPQHRDCEAEQRFRYRSFYSGHTSFAFTGASLICTHHAHLGLFGSAADAGMCVAAMSVAAATGTLRIVADKHYVTDVAVGAASGLLVGFGVPWLFHYRKAPRKILGGAFPNVTIMPAPSGASLVGTF